MEQKLTDAVAMRDAQLCAFFDVDGTLVEFAAVPSETRVPHRLITQLTDLREHYGGAVCLVSGRPIAQLDAMFRPLKLPCAGVHGLERRSADGILHRAPLPTADLESAGRELAEAIVGHSGLLLELKPGAIALHYRCVPSAAQFVRQVMGELAAGHAPAFTLLEGDRVVELLPAGFGKGHAVDAFMGEPPFFGRLPLYIGDDITDFDGLAAVRRHGGFDIAVGDRVSARWHLSGPAEVRRWVAWLLAEQRNPA